MQKRLKAAEELNRLPGILAASGRGELVDWLRSTTGVEPKEKSPLGRKGVKVGFSVRSKRGFFVAEQMASLVFKVCTNPGTFIRL